MKHVVCNGLIAAFILAGSSASHAQTAEPTRVFVNINGGAQGKQRSINTAEEFDIYGQKATTATAQNMGRGSIFDINAGYRVWSDLSIGVGVTTYSKTSQIVGVASVPHPLFLDRHQTTEITSDSKRTERSVYIQAVWSVPFSRFMPALSKLDLALSVGPSFINVEQDVIASVNVPSGTQLATADVQRRKDSTVGAMIGADLTYMVMRNIGAGAFIRYQGGGGLDFPPATNQDTGGVQGGGGLRVRF